jgi:hypothetical protein
MSALPHLKCSPVSVCCLTLFAPCRCSVGAGMGRISMATRDELVAVASERYLRSTRKDRGRILDEFGALTGLHRKHAMRLLRGGTCREQSGPRLRRRVYDDAMREALVVLWEASDRVCGKRLRPLIPILVESMERGVVHFWPLLGNRRARGSGRPLRVALGWRGGFMRWRRSASPTQARWF